MKKIISLFIVSIILLSNICEAKFLISEEITTQTLSKGVTLTKVRRLSSDGSLNINIVAADMKSGMYETEVLISEKGLGSSKTVLDHSKSENTIAAINSDFFDWIKNKSGTSALGIVIKDGKLLTTPQMDAGIFASIVTDKEDYTYFTYLSQNMTLVTPLGYSIKVNSINKWDPWGGITLLTSAWAKESIGKENENTVELVVKDNIVVEKRLGMEPVLLDDETIVLHCDNSVTDFLYNYLSVGEEIKIETEFSFDESEIETSVGGGSIIIKNGEKFAPTQEIAGKNPRSAVGLSKNRDILYLITVDGRQSISAGVTLSELTEILLEFGIYDAINLDGGGSTQMAVRSPKNGEMVIANSPSENRKVPNAFSIISKIKPGEVEKIKIWCPDSLSEGESTSIFVTGYDKNETPISLDASLIEFSSENGSFVNDIFTPNQVGTAIIRANYNDMSLEKEIKILPVYRENPHKKEMKLSPAFSVFSDIASKKSLFTPLFNQKITDNINKGNSPCVFVGTNQTEEFISALNPKTLLSKNEPTIKEYEFGTIFTMNNQNKSFLAQNKEQWLSLKEVLSKSSKNIFIVLPTDLNKTDSEQVRIFKKFLAKACEDGKNIFVFFPTDKAEDTYENGVSYIGINQMSEETSAFDAVNNLKYVDVYIDGEDAFFSYKSIF